MTSIPSGKSSRQGYPQEQEEENRYSLVVRFGKDMLKDGHTAIPNLLLDVYAELGITHCELVFLIHLTQYKWSRHEPYPAISTIAAKMGLSQRAVQNHIQSLKQKAYRCPHTERQDCDCPKFLIVTPRYTVCSGQTSNKYDLSNLFAAVVTLAREKGLIDAAEETCTPRDDKTRVPPMQKVAPKEDESKQTQVESDESLSNSSKGIDEIAGTCSHVAHATIRNTEGNTEEKPAPSNRSNDTQHQTNPTPQPQAERSKSETPPVKERPARRPLATGLSSIAEAMGKEPGAGFTSRKVEPPKMSAPPFTQEDMDKRIRERIARERGKLENPLDDIIPPSHQETLNRQFGGGANTTSCKSRRQPVYEKLQVAVERISEELGDFQHVTSNITQAENIRKAAKMDLEQFLTVLYEARTATKYAQATDRITKRDAAGKLCKMPYFFSVLRDRAGLQKKGI